MENREDPEDFPIRIKITAGKEDLVIKISDRGGGFPRSVLPKARSFVYTSGVLACLAPREPTPHPAFLGLRMEAWSH